MKNKDLQREILKISEGVVSTAMDITLLLTFYGLEAMMKPPTSKGAWQTRGAAFEDWEQINYDTIKTALYRLKNKGLIQYTRETITHPQITKQGLKRLKSTVPTYDKKRAWDGKIYLVTYDIPKGQKNSRERLRYHLKKIGCGRLQNSVWITPYNPCDVLEDFIEKNDLQGAVVISSVGDKENVGEETLRELVGRIYNLEDLDERYFDFNKKYYRFKKFKPEMKSQVIFDFLSILKDDPQLPFKLLPADWPGTEAYQIFKKASKGRLISQSLDTENV